MAAPNGTLSPRQAGRLAASAGAASTRLPHQLFSAGTPSLALGQRRLVGPPLLGGTGPSSSPQRGAIGGPKRFPFPPAGGTTYCFGGRGLNSAPAPTGRGRVTPLFPNRRSRRSPGRKTGYHTAPDGRWRGTKGGIPLHQGVDLLQCTTSPSNLPDRQQRVQHFFLLLTGRAIDWSPPSRKDLIASWQSVGLSLRHGALALPPAACHEASTRYLVRCDNT